MMMPLKRTMLKATVFLAVALLFFASIATALAQEGDPDNSARRRGLFGHVELAGADLLRVRAADGQTYEVVIAGKEGADDTQSMLSVLRASFIPNKVVLFRPDGEPTPAITRLAEFTENQTSLGGKATAYVCLDYACKAPTTDIRAMMKSLGSG